MRVLITTPLFYPSKLGGPSRTLYWLSKGLIRKGVKVSVVTSYSHMNDDSILPDVWTDFNGIKAKYCKTKGKIPINYIWNSFLQLRKCDIVMLSSLFFAPNLFVALCGIILNKKIIWSPRGELLDAAIGSSRKKHIFVLIIKLLCSKPVLFHVTSPEESISVAKFLGSKCKIVLLPNYMEFREKQPRSLSKDNYLLYVGRIAPIKALDNLILALLESQRFLDSDFKLVLAGPDEGGYRRYLIDLVKKNSILQNKVVFIDSVFGTQKDRLYVNAYFSVLLSHSENFGNVVIESMGQGTPVICSTGTPWKVLAEEKIGFWLNNDTKNIANCIDKILQLPAAEYESMRTKCYNFCKDKFDVYENSDKWIEIMNKLKKKT